VTKRSDTWPTIVYRSARELEPTDIEIAQVVAQATTATGGVLTQAISHLPWTRRNTVLALLVFLFLSTMTATAAGLRPIDWLLTPINKVIPGQGDGSGDTSQHDHDTEVAERRAVEFYASLVEDDPAKTCSLALAETLTGIQRLHGAPGCVFHEARYIKMLQRQGALKRIAHPQGATARLNGDKAMVLILFEDGRHLDVRLLRLDGHWYVSDFTLP
jgi:hypothetical protein